MVTCSMGAALAMTPARAQDPIQGLSSGLPLWEPGHAVTTSIKDALPVVTTLKGIDDDLARPIPDDWTFEPGYYRSVIRSYCLHAGTYGPTKGDGYLIAPLKGDRAPLIRNILLRSRKNPKIEQSYVQRLIWGTEDGAQWDAYDNDFKQRVAPLLTTEEIAILNLEPKRAEIADAVKRGLGGLIPGGARRIVDAYADLRSKITGTVSYEELEKFAVKKGAAPWGKDSRKDVQPGPWAFVGDGFYMRAFPESYPTTTLEIYRVVAADVKRDAVGRIVRFDSDGYIIETVYDETPAVRVIDGKSVSVWNFKSVTFRHPDGRVKTYQDRGYVVAETAKKGPAFCSGSSAPDDGDLGDMGHYNDGLKKATDPGDLKGKEEWIKDHMNRVGSAWNAASDSLGGSESTDPKPKKFDPTKFTATPANTGKQRLALSAYRK